MTDFAAPGAVDAVSRAMRTIMPGVSDAAAAEGWPHAIRALASIMTSLLIAAYGGDSARRIYGEIYADVGRVDREWQALLGSEDGGPHPFDAPAGHA
jgi:hypothetical protein